jgi:hypothetical protein
VDALARVDRQRWRVEASVGDANLIGLRLLRLRQGLPGNPRRLAADREK